MNNRKNILRPEWLGHIISGPGQPPLEAIKDATVTGKHDNHCIIVLWMRSQVLRELVTIHSRQ